MTFGRGLAALLLISGLIIGTLRDKSPVSGAEFENGFWILAADLHIHSFPGDGGLSPRDLLGEARRRQLDVIVLTNHNQLLGSRVAHWLSVRSGGVVALAGEEITAPTYHLIAIGVNKAIDWKQPASAAIDAIHQQGGIAIAAHPTHEFSRGYDARALERLDGAEVAHPTMFGNERRRRELELFYHTLTARNRQAAAVGSSDAHFLAPVGRSRTYVFATERTEKGILDAIRRGRTVACDIDGNLYGDPSLIRLLKGRAGPSQSPGDRWQLAAVAMVWTGLFGLVLFGGRKRAARTH